MPQPDDQAAVPTGEQVDDARAAYAAYGQATGGKNYRGEPMPDWDGLGDTIQAAWVATAAAVRRRAAHEATGGPGSGSRAWWEARREQLCEWARANSLDPDDIPADAAFEIRDGQISVDVVVRDADGNTVPSGSGRNSAMRTKRTVPLVVPLPWPHLPTEPTGFIVPTT